MESISNTIYCHFLWDAQTRNFAFEFEHMHIIMHSSTYNFFRQCYIMMQQKVFAYEKHVKRDVCMNERGAKLFKNIIKAKKIYGFGINISFCSLTGFQSC